MSDWRKDQERFGSRSFDQDRWRDDDHRSHRSDWDRPRNYGRDDDNRQDYGNRQAAGWAGHRDDWSTSDVARNRDDQRQNYGRSSSDYGRSDYGRSDYGRSNLGRSDYGRSEDRNFALGRNDWRGGSSGDWRSSNEFGRRSDSGVGDWGRGGSYGDRNSSSYNRDWDRNARSNDERSFWDRATDEVSSWFGDRDAEQRRNMDEVRSHRGRGPKGYARSDERIREDVSDRLSDDWRVDASEIEVSVANSEVTLTGTVDSREAKRRAEDCAESVSGVKHVQNNLRVQNQTSSWSSQSATGQSGFGSTSTTSSASTAPSATTSGTTTGSRQRV